MEQRPYYMRHKEDDYIDEVRIVTRERYKTSGMSGDEWRYSRVMQFFRKGTLLWESAFNGSVGAVASWVPWMLVDAGENGKWKPMKDDHLCFQPGCSNVAVSEYEIIEEFGPQGQRLHPQENNPWSKRRRFCQRHLRRGDCGREDCDANYRVISGPGPDANDWSDARISESARMDVTIESLDDLPAAIESARKNLS